MTIKVKLNGFTRTMIIPKISGSQLLAEGYTKDKLGFDIKGSKKYRLKQKNSVVTITELQEK